MTPSQGVGAQLTISKIRKSSKDQKEVWRSLMMLHCTLHSPNSCQKSLKYNANFPENHDQSFSPIFRVSFDFGDGLLLTHVVQSLNLMWQISPNSSPGSIYCIILYCIILYDILLYYNILYFFYFKLYHYIIISYHMCDLYDIYIYTYCLYIIYRF